MHFTTGSLPPPSINEATRKTRPQCGQGMVAMPRIFRPSRLIASLNLGLDRFGRNSVPANSSLIFEKTQVDQPAKQKHGLGCPSAPGSIWPGHATNPKRLKESGSNQLARFTSLQAAREHKGAPESMPMRVMSLDCWHSQWLPSHRSPPQTICHTPSISKHDHTCPKKFTRPYD